MTAIPILATDPKAVLARHGRTFALASRFMGAETSARAARLYTFCRHLDDLVDERATIQSARRALQQTRYHLATGSGLDPIVEDFISLAEDTSLDPALGVILIDGLESDLGNVAIETQQELVQYAYRVAGVVGLMMCAVMDVSDSRALPFAIDLGIAMQLTNIARDIREDAAMGRRYIPGNWINHLSARELVVPCDTTEPTVKAALERLLSLADDFYRSAALGLHYIPVRSRVAIRVARSAYREIGQLIARRNFSVIESRTVVAPTRKAVVSAKAVLIEPMMVPFRTANRIPHAELHAALHGLPGTCACEEDNNRWRA